MARCVAVVRWPSSLPHRHYVALRAFREYSASIFLTAPGTEVFAVLVLDMWEGGNSNILSAYVTMVIALMSVLMVVFGKLGRRLGVHG